jgi:PPOX class probable F420-dependent enzyme
MAIADEKYVSLTTFRKSGEGVSTPVWIAPLPASRLGVFSAPDAWKIKRLKNNPAVQLTPCDMRGKLTPGAATVTGTGAVFTAGPQISQVRAALNRKYGILGYLTTLGSVLKARLTRTGFTVIVIDLAA